MGALAKCKMSERFVGIFDIASPIHLSRRVSSRTARCFFNS